MARNLRAFPRVQMRDVRSLPPAEVAIASVLAAGLWALQTPALPWPQSHRASSVNSGKSGDIYLPKHANEWNVARICNGSARRLIDASANARHVVAGCENGARCKIHLAAKARDRGGSVKDA
jgi:hypothetical protein